MPRKQADDLIERAAENARLGGFDDVIGIAALASPEACARCSSVHPLEGPLGRKNFFGGPVPGKKGVKRAWNFLC
ncbi:MAG: hypothetical protein K9N23_02785 [Akkermansiaceae bacterium]|nr:hypothetical protein [Akkermansiaceae bacterium]MCF7730579.1 hypothetical protein [Akkermansiaceae bacterium]